MTDDPTSNASNTRRLAQRAVNALLNLCRRGNRLAAGVLMLVTLICVTGLLLGYAAFDGGTQIVWALIGGFFGIIAIGLVIAVLRSLRIVTKSADGLLREVQGLLEGNIVTERTVIETVEAADSAQGESALVLSRQFSGLQTEVISSGRDLPNVGQALSSIARFPAYIGLAALISLVFAVLSPLFAISLLL